MGRVIRPIGGNMAQVLVWCTATRAPSTLTVYEVPQSIIPVNVNVNGVEDVGCAGEITIAHCWASARCGTLNTNRTARQAAAEITVSFASLMSKCYTRTNAPCRHLVSTRAIGGRCRRPRQVGAKTNSGPIDRLGKCCVRPLTPPWIALVDTSSQSSPGGRGSRTCAEARGFDLPSGLHRNEMLRPQRSCWLS
jgi:hypothetical protein